MHSKRNLFRKLFFIFICTGLLYSSSIAQLNGPKLLEKSIEYHDPNGHWNSFKQTFIVTTTSPEGKNLDREVFIDNVSGTFSMNANYEPYKYYFISSDTIILKLGDRTDLSEEEIEENRMTSDFAKIYRNYFIYLYGLPMKLTDPGTKIHDTIEEVVFYDRSCYKMKVTYDPSVGKDIWYFYFDKASYALVAYQFYHDETINDGEYILLEGIKEIGGIKIPSDRTWYINKDDRILGVDIIK